MKNKKRVLAAALSIVIGLTASACGQTKQQPDQLEEAINKHVDVMNMAESMIDGTSTFKHEAADFEKGSFTQTKLENKALVLADGALSGEYESPILETNAFTSFVASWNANTSEQSTTQLQFQVRVEDQWSEWMSCGTWTRAKTRGSASATYDLAKVDVDTIVIANDKSATALKFKVILTRETEDVASPAMRRVIASMTFQEAIAPSASVAEGSYLKELAVPARSQMVVPDIGENICSGTSLSMVLEYFGTNIPTADVAWGVRDYGAELFGNWTFNMAFAGEQGYEAYVEQGATFDSLKAYIAADTPVVLSIVTNKNRQISSAPMFYPNGHLLVLVGFVERNNTLFAIVNDPASPSDDKVRHEYLASQLEKAWIHINYVVKKEV